MNYPLGLKKNGDHWENEESNLILSCPNIFKSASVKAISQRPKPQTAALQYQHRSKVSTGLAFPYSEKEREKKPSTPFTHHSSSISLISGRGILTSKGFPFPCVFLASVSPLPMCEGQVSILDHVLRRKHKHVKELQFQCKSNYLEITRLCELK